VFCCGQLVATFGQDVTGAAGQNVFWVGHWVTMPITAQTVGDWLHWVLAAAGHWVITRGKNVAPHNWPGSLGQ
jgi:hypothetical protein